MANTDERRTIVNLLTDVISEVTELFQTELRLIRAEINDKVSRVANSGTLIASGAVAALAAVFLILQAIVSWLAVAGIPQQWGYLVVGVLVAILSAVLVSRGLNALRATSLVPNRTIDQLKSDFATVKEHVK
jgi:Putative Actinobacterial Holin-X, holin superfamily III